MNVTIQEPSGGAIGRGNGNDFGIESIRSHEFSIGIFIFLIICIFLFVGIIIKFMRAGGSSTGKSLKTGEKVMFGWIFLGVAVAIVMGVMQILMGRLL